MLVWGFGLLGKWFAFLFLFCWLTCLLLIRCGIALFVVFGVRVWMFGSLALVALLSVNLWRLWFRVMVVTFPILVLV